MPPPVYSRVAIRIGFGRLPPAGAREGKDHGDTDAHCARYQETRPAGAVARADSAASSRGSRDGREVRGYGGLLAQAEGGSQVRVEDRPVRASGGRVAGGRSSAAQEAAAHDQARARPSAGGDGLRRRVFDHDALRAPVARGEPRRAGSRGVRAARVGGGQHAGRFRRGPGPDRWRDGGRALPGGLVAVFEHAVVRGVAGRERGVSVPWFDARVRAYRGCASRDRDGQRDRCRPAQREGRGRVDRGVLRVRGALPARGPVLQPVFGQREGQRGERGRVFAAQSHGAAHARGIVWAVEPSPAGAVRRARQGLVLPEVAGRARGRGVRRGEGRVDAVAVHGVRPGSLGKPDGRQVRAGRHRLEPVPRRPRFGAFQGIGRDPVGHGHAHLARHRRALRGVSQTVRTVAQCGGSRARASPARGQTPRVAGKLDPPGRVFVFN